jgi:membrane protease YdiL (CAAX protease family)
MTFTDTAGSERSTRPTPHVRWTLFDMLAVVAGGFAIAVLLLMVVSFVNWRGVGLDAALLEERTLLLSMSAGALVYGLFFLMTYVLIIRRRQVSWRDLGFRSPPALALSLLVPIFVGQCVLISIVNTVVLQLIGQFQNPQVAALTAPGGFAWSNFVAVFAVAAIIAPIVEEILFRGLLYQWLRAHTSVAVAVIVSAAIFSAVHVIPLLFPALFVVGVILALVFEWTRSLWTTIALHFLQNSLAVIGIFVLQAYGFLPQV